MVHSRKNLKNKRYIKDNVLTSDKSWMKGQTSPDGAVAYCHNKNHLGYLNENLIKQHKCLEKKCVYLNKYEQKTFWSKKKIVNAVKKYHKNNNKGYIGINDKRFVTDNIEKLLNVVNTEIEETGEIPEILYIREGD